MKRLEVTIAHALNELGDQPDKTLGGVPAITKPADEDWRERLIERLVREADVHKWMLLGILLACLVLFGTGIFLLLYHIDKPSSYQLIFGGGSLVGMLSVLNVARLILIDKAGYDILISVVTVLPPEQVVIALKNLKYMKLAKK